jgi:BirA family transcriptional regulator, biotin operon repressor / biotin---[acetyl-CoA-carboxylase] ligase
LIQNDSRHIDPDGTGPVLPAMPTARITLVAETRSTNADLLARADSWPEGHWLRAHRQTAGRGRLGRDWRAAAGNLFASTLIRLQPGDPPVSGLGLLVGVALHEAVRALLPGAGVALKWPNDLMAGKAKLAGILLERQGNAVIVGVGVNVRVAPAVPGRDTMALADLPGGGAIDAARLLDALAARVDGWCTAWRAAGFAPVRTAWLAAAHPIGTRLHVGLDSERHITGRFQGVADDGALLVELDDGTQRLLHSGDVGFL